jgi:hypothetical protein
MRLSEVLELPEFKTRAIIVIGTYKTSNDKEWAVLARRGEKVLPIPTVFHLVEDGPENRDPEISQSEVSSIRRRFPYFEAISKLASR